VPFPHHQTIAKMKGSDTEYQSLHVCTSVILSDFYAVVVVQLGDMFGDISIPSLFPKSAMTVFQPFH
jgi:hypothetical protein